jgi:SAM-dependent methyltransferase
MDLLYKQIGLFFDKKVDSFDGIYTGDKKIFGRLWDILTRSNIFLRFDYAMKAFNPIKGKKILDAGCGPGRYCLAFLKGGASYVLGVDSSAEMIKRAKMICAHEENTGLYEFLCANILEIHGCFDFTSAIGFFDYINDPHTILTHLRSITKGRLVASFPAKLAFRYPFRKLYFLLNKIPVMFYTKKQVTKMIKASCFKLVEIKKIGPIYIITAD